MDRAMSQAFQYAIAGLLVLAGAPALAMYRCGNVYQDKPCESGPEIRLSPSGRPAAVPAPAPVAPAVRSLSPVPSPFAMACARVGEQAQRIVWKREGGATQEQQLAEPPTVLSPQEQARTIAAVYARRGSAPEIRAAIQAECIVDKQKEAQAAELLDPLRRQAGDPAGSPAAGTAPQAAPGSTGDSAQVRPAAASIKPSASTCASLRQSVDNAKARLRQGGSAATMEVLENGRRSAEASLRNSGCT